MTEPIPTFRDSIWLGAPTWLRNGINQKILYALALHVDTLGDMLSQGIRARFPGLVSYQSLKLLGRDRRVPRGRYESNETYASRLPNWLDDHRHRGGPYALLDQLHKHYAPNVFPIELIYRSGRRYSMAVDGTIVRDDLPDWNPGLPAEQWATVTLIYHTDQFPLPLSADDAADITLIPNAWNAAHVQGRIILLTESAGVWDNSMTPFQWDSPNTDGTNTWDGAGDSTVLTYGT